MTVHVTTRDGAARALSPAAVQRRAEKMLRALGVRGVELSVALSGDAAIRDLNRAFRGKDRPTDVLAFPAAEPPTPPPRVRKGRREGEAPFDPGAFAGLLGDVIVSVETAARQAAERRVGLLDEATMLVAHGLLHLVGYDHRTDAEEAEMTARTRALERAARARASG